ncbi:MAG: hypothetical protein ACFFDT_13840 [Candidatus Hodarchaeota archaeon]
MELTKQRKELLDATMKQIKERKILAAKYRNQSLEHQRRRFEAANRFRRPYFEKLLELLKVENKQLEELQRKDLESLRKFNEKQYKQLIKDLKSVSKTYDNRIKNLLDYRKNYNESHGNPVHVFCGLQADLIDKYINFGGPLPDGVISQPALCENIVRFQWDAPEWECYDAGFKALFFWDDPPAGFIGATAEIGIIGAYLLEAGYACYGGGQAQLQGDAKLHLSQGGANPLYISEEIRFIDEMATGPGWNEGSIGFPGPIPMGVGTVNVSIPQNVRIVAGTPLLGTVEVEFFACSGANSRVLVDFNSEDHLKLNFTALLMTVES